jgi:hypothetical protein
MLRSNRGVARVSVTWLVVVGLLFIGALAFAFVASSGQATERDLKETALREKTEAETRAEEAAAAARSVSKSLGWIDEESTDPRSKLDLVTEELTTLRGVFTDLTEQDDRVDEILPKVREAYDARQRQIAELDARIKELEAEAATREKTITDITAQKDEKIADLERQLADETQTAATRSAELERKVASLEQQFSDRDQDFRRLQNEAATTTRDRDREKLALETRTSELSRQLRFQRAPFNGLPDGKILSVSDQLPLAWIDIGANQRVVPGVRFRVQSGTPGEDRLKAWAEVTRVDAGMAEVAIYDVADAFDPVAPGDVVLNPVFDPKGGRNAILVGRFTGQHSKEDLSQLLEAMGVHVQDDLDLTTTFMIVGAPLYNDPETGEPLETPLEPSDLAIYKEAEASNVQVIPLAEMREYFRVETRPSQPASQP